ncbi:MAG: hypothetical protein HUU21_38385 [Polyangiaceae bacterium]|nr:hypothetical protein [Polyangiaceae bacterium]
MTSSIKRMALCSAVILAMGFAFMPMGCGGSGRGPAHGDAALPEGIALRFRTCAVAHRTHLSSGEHSVSFDVKLADDGRADSVALNDSTLGDEDLEDCMADALQSLSVDDLPIRRSGSRHGGSVASGSRALFGHPEAALACLASPPCLLTLTFLIGASYITVQIYLYALSTAATETAVSTTEIDCKKVKQDCIYECSDEELPTSDVAASYWQCLRKCMEAKGCY